MSQAHSAIVKDVQGFCGSVEFKKGVKEAQLDIICGEYAEINYEKDTICYASTVRRWCGKKSCEFIKSY